VNVVKFLTQLPKQVQKFANTDQNSFLNHLSIRNRLIFIFLAVSMIPLTIIGFLSYYISKAAISDKITQYSLRELVQITNNLNLELKKFEEFTLNTMSNEAINKTLRECVTDQSLTFIDINQRLRIFDDQVMAWNTDGTAILFCSVKRDIDYLAGTGKITAGAFRKTADFQKTVAQKGKIHWFYQNGCLGFSRLIGDTSTMQPIGVLAITINTSRLDQVINYTLYKQSALSEKTILAQPYSMIVNQEGVILASPFTDDLGQNITTLTPERNLLKRFTDLGEATGKFPVHVKNKAVLMTVNPISEKGWYLLGLAPNSYLYAESAMVGLWALGMGVVMSVGVIFISIIVALGISNPLQLVMKGMKQAENGDLSVSVNLKKRDELGQLGRSFDRMISQIQSLTRETKAVVAEVLTHSKVLEESSVQSAQAAKAVVKATMEISRGTVEQTREAEKTSQKMVDLSKQIESVVTKSNEMQGITESVRQMGLKSRTIVEQLMKKANETDVITNMAVKDMCELSSSAEEIKGLTGIITGIAEQTNLLALNASIEAARAGKYGLGFAVVAEEINKLAAQSQEAAKTIEKILREIQQRSATSTQTVSRAHQIVEEQMTAVDQTQQFLDGIHEAMRNVVSRITEVNESIRRMNEVKEETTHAIMNISAISEETAAASEEVYASSEEQTAIAEQVSNLAGALLKKSVQLSNNIAEFKVDIS
jgi:methyl-accepting chemotaxis protein